MKKTSLIVGAVIGLSTASVFAQGYVTCNLTSATPVSTNNVTVNDPALGASASGLVSKGAANSFYYELLVQPYSGSFASTSLVGVANLNGWLDSGLGHANSTTFNGYA